jgi:hypothetical protein
MSNGLRLRVGKLEFEESVGLLDGMVFWGGHIHLQTLRTLFALFDYKFASVNCI